MGIESVCWINGQPRSDGCNDVGLWGCVETCALRRRSFGDGAWPNVALSSDVDKAATEKRFPIMPGEGAMRRDLRGGYNASIDIEIPQINEVV